MPAFRDMSGQTVGDWTILSYNGRGTGHYRCRCTCGVERDVNRANLQSGSSTNCGCKAIERSRQPRLNLIGQRFGLLTPIARGEKDAHGKHTYVCRCDCGGRSVVSTIGLTGGNSRSCGCRRVETMTAAREVDRRGVRFGRLLPIVRERTRAGARGWRCACDCGAFTVVADGNLASGNTTSCGCLKRDRATGRPLEVRLARKAIVHRSRARRMTGDPGDLTAEQIIQLVAEFSGHCPDCGTAVEPGDTILDHRQPLVLGGRNTLSNVRLTCEACNCRKWKFTMEQWQARRVGVVTSSSADDGCHHPRIRDQAAKPAPRAAGHPR